MIKLGGKHLLDIPDEVVLTQLPISTRTLLIAATPL
jgi:hypothetical protein